MCPKLPQAQRPPRSRPSTSVADSQTPRLRPALRLRATALVCAVAGFLGFGVARADTITLADNTQIAGRVVHFYDNTLAIETSNGQKLELPKEKIKAITFKLPPARPEFATPEKTFERWRGFMLKGEVQKAIDCYALMFQGMMQQQMLQTPDAIKQAQKDMEGIKIELRGSSVQKQGDLQSATLKVRRTKGENVQTDDVHFVLENGEWKMTP